MGLNHMWPKCLPKEKMRQKQRREAVRNQLYFVNPPPFPVAEITRRYNWKIII